MWQRRCVGGMLSSCAGAQLNGSDVLELSDLDFVLCISLDYTRNAVAPISESSKLQIRLTCALAGIADVLGACSATQPDYKRFLLMS